MMGMTNAERQRAYRERHLGAGGEKVRREIIWDAAADARLRRLARHRELPVTEALEDLVRRAEQAAVGRMTPTGEKRYLRHL